MCPSSDFKELGITHITTVEWELFNILTFSKEKLFCFKHDHQAYSSSLTSGISKALIRPNVAEVSQAPEEHVILRLKWKHENPHSSCLCLQMEYFWCRDDAYSTHFLYMPLCRSTNACDAETVSEKCRCMDEFKANAKIQSSRGCTYTALRALQGGTG